jgi:hypothetical protein
VQSCPLLWHLVGYFCAKEVKKTFQKAEQNAKDFNKHGGESGEKSVDKMMMGAEAAQTLALQALSWVLGQDELLGFFLSSTGASPQDLGKLATTPLFLGAVLDFLMEDDQRVINFCTDHGHPLTAVQGARAALPGAQYMHWT